jgi:hypothetical protein
MDCGGWAAGNSLVRLDTAGGLVHANALHLRGAIVRLRDSHAVGARLMDAGEGPP